MMNVHVQLESLNKTQPQQPALTAVSPDLGVKGAFWMVGNALRVILVTYSMAHLLCYPTEKSLTLAIPEQEGTQIPNLNSMDAKRYVRPHKYGFTRMTALIASLIVPLVKKLL